MLSKEMLQVFNSSFQRLFSFYNSKEFQRLMSELLETPSELRHDFVEIVIMSDEQLARRGIQLPDDIEIQRTQFADQRPTLFCLTKKVNLGPWRKLTITVDNDFGNYRPVLAKAVEMDELTTAVSR